MNNPELEEYRKEHRFSWMMILKIAICILILVLLVFLIKDYLMPKKIVSVGVSSPSPVILDTPTIAK